MSCRFNLNNFRKISSANSKWDTYFTKDDNEKIYEIFPYDRVNYMLCDNYNFTYVSLTSMQDAKYVFDFLKSIRGNTSKFVIAFWEGEYRTDAFILDDVKNSLKYMEIRFNDRWKTFNQCRRFPKVGDK